MNNLHYPGFPSILVVDDEECMRERLSSLFQAEGLAVGAVGSIEEACSRQRCSPADVILLDSNIGGVDGLAAVSSLRGGGFPSAIVMMVGYGVTVDALKVMRSGVCDLVEKPFTDDRVLAVVCHCLESRQQKMQLAQLETRVRELTATEIFGLSPAIQAVRTQVVQAAQAPDTAALIVGGAGSGKELVARCIHERSTRRHGPFAVINCARLTESSFEEDLFGHEPGALMSVDREGGDGRLVLAAGGTLYFDEISALTRPMQAKLLRVLQSRMFRKVGGAQDLIADVRVIGSTSKDLRSEVEREAFREDLFYRLNVMSIEVPSLSARPEDIPLLSHFYLDHFSQQTGKSLTGFTEEAMEILTEHSWPANVRELKNTIERAVTVCHGGMIEAGQLPPLAGDDKDLIAQPVISLKSTDRTLRGVEGKLVSRVLGETRWNISKAAAQLGINRTTLYNKIKLHGLGRRPCKTEGLTRV